MATFSFAAFLLLLLAPKNFYVDAGVELVADIPQPNLRGGCTPRCSNTVDNGRYRCDVDVDGNRLCNTFELLGPHTCHFHYYTQSEVARCMAEKRPPGQRAPFNYMVFGSSILMGTLFAAAPWLDYQIDSDFDYQDWMFDSLPPGSMPENVMNNCAQLVLDINNGVVDKKADFNGDCTEVYEHSRRGNGAFRGQASIVWAAAYSPDLLDVQLDHLLEAGREQDEGHMVLYLGQWYIFCLLGRQWACDILGDEGEDLQELAGEEDPEEALEMQVEYFQDKYTAVVLRIIDEFPNISLTLTGLRRYSVLTRRFDDVIRQLAVGLEYLSLDGTCNLEPNQPPDILDHPSPMVNHALFQRLMSSMCADTSVGEALECEEEVVGSPGCQTETYDNPSGDWFAQFDRGCNYKAFTSVLPDVLFLAPAPTCVRGGPNLFANPGVERRLAPWQTYSRAPENSISHVEGNGNGGARFNIARPGGADWHVQLFQVLSVSELTLGERFTVTFDVLSNEGTTRLVYPYIQQVNAPYEPLSDPAPCSVGPSDLTQCSVTGVISSVATPVKFGIQGGESAVDFSVHGASLCRDPERTCGDGSGGLLANSNLDDGFGTSWRAYVKPTGTPLDASFSADNGAVTFNIDTAARNSWHMLLSQTIPAARLEQGVLYTLSFRLKAESTRTVRLFVRQQGRPNTFFARKTVTISPTEAIYTVTTEITSFTRPVRFGIEGGASDVDFTVDDALLCATPVPRTCRDGSIGLLENSNLDDGIGAPWQTYVKPTGTPLDASFSTPNGAVRFNIETAGRNSWHMLLYQRLGVEQLEQGALYTFSFRLQADSSRAVRLFVRQQGRPNAFFARKTVTISPTEDIYTVSAVVDDLRRPVRFGVEGGASAVDFIADDALLCSTAANGLFRNPRFSAGTDGLNRWEDYLALTLGIEGSWSRASEAGGAELEVTALAAAPMDWHAQMFQSFNIETAGTYRLAFEISAPEGDFLLALYAQQVDDFVVLDRTTCVAVAARAWCVLEAEVVNVPALIKFGAEGGNSLGKVVLHEAMLALLP